MGNVDMSYLDAIENATIEFIELDREAARGCISNFVKEHNERNHYFSVYTFDLYSVIDFKPSITVWSKLIKGEYTNEAETWLLKELVSYVLDGDKDIKFTTMIKPLVESIRNTLRITYKLEVNEVTNDLVVEITKYITALAGRLNTVTHNILTGAKDMSRGFIDYGDLSCIYNLYDNANEYFDNEDTPLVYIHTISLKITDKGYRGFVIIWSLRKKHGYHM